jgi:hypothetical protein
MLSEHVQWVDLDNEQWARLWNLLYGPDRQPVRLYGLLDAGKPVALMHARRGQLSLREWPRMGGLQDVAEHFYRAMDVDQVILVERSAIKDLWDRQQRAYDRDEDYDDYALRLSAMTEAMVSEQAICVPDRLSLPARPPVRFGPLIDLIRHGVEESTSFLLMAFQDNAIWFSLAGRVQDGKIVTLTTSQGLTEPGRPPPEGEWRVVYRDWLKACASRLGTPSLGIFLDVEAFRGLPFADDPVSHLMEAQSNGRAILDPWSSVVDLLAGAAARRASGSCREKGELRSQKHQ